MATAACPGIAWHSGTASAACRRRCTTRPWVPLWPRSVAPCATTPCGSCSSGNKGRPTAGRQVSTATWPVPKPWSTCQTTLFRATLSHPRLLTAPCPCTVPTLRCDLTTWATLAQRFLLPSTEETWALIDGPGHKSTRSVEAWTVTWLYKKTYCISLVVSTHNDSVALVLISTFWNECPYYSFLIHLRYRERCG